jgi:hypothetical protein
VEGEVRPGFSPTCPLWWNSRPPDPVPEKLGAGGMSSDLTPKRNRLGPTQVTNSLCRGQENCTMHKPAVLRPSR